MKILMMMIAPIRGGDGDSTVGENGDDNADD